MPLPRVSPILNYTDLEDNRTIYPAYKCNCTKDWKQNDKFIIYKANKNTIEKIFESDIVDNNINSITTTSLIGHDLTDKIIVSGGHTVVNLSDRFHVGQEVIKSVDFSFKLIAELQKQHAKKAEFLVMLNDFYMEKDAGTDDGAENKYRKEALNPYLIPPKINKFLLEYSDLLGRNMDLYYCSEKNMADRFKRHIQNQKKSNDKALFIQKDNNNWDIMIGDNVFPVMINGKPTCVSGNAATFRAIRYEVTSNKIKDYFTSYVGMFPLCSVDNVLNGYRAANAFYEPFNLPSYLIFFGKSCF